MEVKIYLLTFSRNYNMRHFAHSVLWSSITKSLGLHALNKTLINANRELRVELAKSSSENHCLQKQILQLNRRITQLERATSEERAEMIVSNRLQVG